MFLFQWLRGITALLLYLVNIVVWCVPVILLAFIKVIPLKFHLPLVNKAIGMCADSWVWVNIQIQYFIHPTKIQVSNLPQLSMSDWYLIICNHKSGVDILLLQSLFYKKIPLLRFFLKQQLIWVPLMGIAWWALDFPFMRRYSRSFIEKHPHLKGKDLTSTQKACEKFQHLPVSIVNFVEGTRYSRDKHKSQSSPFKHLLKPKAGGIAFTLSAMQQKLNKVLNVTIHYPQSEPTLWDYLCGKLDAIIIDVKLETVDDLNQRSYFDNPNDREIFQQWLNQRWEEKDEWLDSH